MKTKALQLFQSFSPVQPPPQTVTLPWICAVDALSVGNVTRTESVMVATLKSESAGPSALAHWRRPTAAQELFNMKVSESIGTRLTISGWCFNWNKDMGALIDEMYAGKSGKAGKTHRHRGRRARPSAEKLAELVSEAEAEVDYDYSAYNITEVSLNFPFKEKPERCEKWKIFNFFSRTQTSWWDGQSPNFKSARPMKTALTWLGTVPLAAQIWKRSIPWITNNYDVIIVKKKIFSLKSRVNEWNAALHAVYNY